MAESKNIIDIVNKFKLLNDVIKGGDYADACILLDAGANIEVTDSDGRTLLFQSVAAGYKQWCELLLDHKANIEARDSNGRTPFMLALLLGHEKIYKLLLERGANINACDKNGRTALHLTVSNKSCPLVKFLLTAGARTDIENMVVLVFVLLSFWLSHVIVISMDILPSKLQTRTATCSLLLCLRSTLVSKQRVRCNVYSLNKIINSIFVIKFNSFLYFCSYVSEKEYKENEHDLLYLILEK